MLAYTYLEKGKFALQEKPEPVFQDPRDAIVRVTLSSICTSDLHIKHGSVPRAVPGITVGHEMVGIVEKTGTEVKRVKAGERVTVNVETFCGHCFFCQQGFVNNCTDPNGGWALGCRIDGGQAEYVRVPYADQGLNRIPENVSDEQALFVGDILATGFWASRISEIKPGDTVLIIGAGPTGICTLLCCLLKNPGHIIVCESRPDRIRFVQTHYPEVLVCGPETCKDFVASQNAHGGADVVIEVAGSESSFRLAWECARPNAVVTLVALYDEAQQLPLPEMYGKNLTFKTGGVDACDCEEILRLVSEGKIDTRPLITHRFPLNRIEEAYQLFESKADGVMKIAVENTGAGTSVRPEKNEVPAHPEKRYTPEHISQLAPQEVFVFGSNLQGAHAGGAARIALGKFGAIWGQGTGLQGQSYAIPTMHGGVDAIKPYVDEFIAFAHANPGLTFLVTRIGCGIAGFTDREIAPLFAEARNCPNVVLPESFCQILQNL